MPRYIYKGPVMEFNTLLADIWEGETVAPSEKKARSRDKQLAGEIQQPYQKIVTYETTEYDDLTIEKAYEYLKTLPEFEGAEDILEEKHILS